jgi:LPXTG-motif cell wall-anchored protein
MLTHTAKRITVAGFAGSLLAIAPVALPAADAAPATGCRQYAVASTTTTTLSLSPQGPYGIGQGFTATATVKVDATGTAPSSGDVTFKYGSSSKTVAVSGGTASATFTAKNGRTQISATFSGECLGNSIANGTSSDRTAVVAGVEASRGKGGLSTTGGTGGTGGNGGDSGIAGVSASSGGGTVAGLAATGADSQTELFGVLGLGLVTVGGLTLLVRRRRVQG